MGMILKIAWANFYRQGTRSVLNVLITGLAMVAVVFSISLYNGFQAQATRNMIRTDVGGGHYRLPDFDILTPTEWEDRTFEAPAALRGLADADKAEVLVQQGQIFPRRRLYPVQLRGMGMVQGLLDLPLDRLRNWQGRTEEQLPAILGTKMAQRAKLKTGDTMVLKWRDRNGVVDARDLVVVDVVPIINPRIDEGVVWLRLDHLRRITRREGEVSWVAVRHAHGPLPGVEFQSPDQLMEDILHLIKTDRRYARIFWAILVFLAGIGVFNTQILNVFRRQKEIGTLMAIGMTSRQIVTLFTLEGSLAAFLSVFAALVLGTAIFSWFQSVGLDVSHLSESSIPVRERVLLKIIPREVVLTGAVIVSIMMLVSWLPVRKISRLDPTLALRGRGIT